MPDLLDIPDGTSVFVDTNIFHFHFQNKSRACTAFLNRIIRGDVEAYVNTQVLSDLLHKLMMTNAIEKGCIREGTNPQPLKNYLRWLHLHPEENSLLTDYQQQFEFILSVRVRVLPINEQLLIATKMERQTFFLMTGDSIHLGTMNRRTINRQNVPLQHIATHDGDFEHIPGITVWRPMDIPMKTFKAKVAP
ncbi:MAG: type II toxin-antitoxin system VapC family toxin [Ktedonobacteraceae bacterium]